LIAMRGSVPRVRRRIGRRVAAPASGGNTSRALGRGLDFAEVREYYPGDDVRLIDWNVTARSGRPHTKVFNEEKERPFVVVVDLRRSMRFATRVAYKSVIAARLAAMLGWAAADNRDRVGALVFNDQAIGEVKPVAGARGVSAVIRSIVSMHQSPVTGEISTDLSSVLQRLDQRIHAGSSVVLLSDFYGYDTASKGGGNRLLANNHVASIQIYDPLEAGLPPPALYSVSDGLARSHFDSSDQAGRDAYAHAFERRAEALASALSGPGNTFRQCSVADSLRPIAVDVMRSLPGSQ
jgi:uncharacterized protein (DUF58 family)